MCSGINTFVVAPLSFAYDCIDHVRLFDMDNGATTYRKCFFPCVFCLCIFVSFVAFLRCSVSAVLAVFSLLCSVCLCLLFLLVGRYRLHKLCVLIS